MPTSPSTSSGLDLAHVDAAVRPQDDLFGHVNGSWLAAHEIPADRSSDGAFRALFDAAEEQVRAIVEEAAASAPAATTGEAAGGSLGQVGRAYRAFMDVDRVEALGAAPLEPLLAEVAAVADRSALAGLVGRYQREGLVALVAAYVSPDAKDSSRYVVYAEQAGLGLPDEAYYRLDEHAEVRAKYVEHLDRLCAMAGLEPLGATVLDLETALAAVSWDRVSRRDAHRTYTLMTWDELVASAPGLDWEAWRAALLDLDTADGPAGASRLPGVSADALAEVVVRQPSFVTGAAALVAERPSRCGWCAASPRTCRPTSWRSSSTSPAARCRARRSCASAGAAASRSWRGPSARPWASCTWSGTSRRARRSAWSSWWRTSSRRTGSRSRRWTG